MRYIALLTLLGLAACGVDGEPTTPEPQAKAQPGISITGRAEIGIARRSYANPRRRAFLQMDTFRGEVI